MAQAGVNPQVWSGAVAAPSARDLRIDFWRGAALLAIFVNHIPGNIFEPLTWRNFGLSDAAELFVFLAGFSAALAYFPKFLAGDHWRQTWRSLSRAASLHVTHVVSLVACIALFGIAADAFDDPSYLQMNNIGPVIDDPLAGVIGIATLGHQIGYFNILPMYVVMLAALPLIMLLARIDLMLPLFAATGLYVAANLAGWNLPHYPNDDHWFFNPLAWQLLFVIGFTLGAVARSGAKIPFNSLIYWLAAAYLVASLIIAVGYDYVVPAVPGVPSFLVALDKTNLSLPRLLHILALAYVVAHTPAVTRALTALRPDNAMVALGRNALPVFCTGSLLSMVGLLLRERYGSHALLDLAIVGAGFLLLVGLVRALDWSRRQSRPSHARVSLPLSTG
ncbi:MAG: OpgC family protein [Alphaproteobacteria bacterium]